MSVLRNLEDKIAGAFEGTFSRVFRSAVRPIEIARKLAREMEDHQHPALQHVYVPNEYHVWLSPKDRDRFASYEDALAIELGSYLLEHARRERFTLLSAPVIEFDTDSRLGLGQFGIQTSTVTSAQARAASGSAPVMPPTPPPSVDRQRAREQSGKTMVFSTAERIAAPLSAAATARQQRAVLIYNGRRLIVGADGATLGRSRENDIVVEDTGASRKHAELRSRGGAWVLTDLRSTNGTKLNGRRVDHPEVIQPGDEIRIGSSTLEFELE
jgi:Protein of unknown function (DUF3662)/FHA domain